MYKITKREINLEDYLQLKKFKPFKKMRQDAKGVNFGAIFACTGSTLGRQMRNAGFTEEDCDYAIDTFNLHNVMAASIGKKPYMDDTIKLKLKYDIVGTKLREIFFQTYPGLLDRVTREQSFALKHGYVRTWCGPVRHLAELRFMSKNAQNNVIGADHLLYSKMFTHLKNDASNTTIQTAEVYQAMPDVTCLQNNLDNWNFKSWVFNYVHDSIQLYIYKPEKEIVYALLNKLAKIHRMPYYGLSQHIGVEESDLTNPNEYMKHGREINIEHLDLDLELKKWNEKYNTNLEFTNNIPIYGELK